MSLVTLDKLNRFYNNHIKSMFTDIDDRIEETEAEVVSLGESITSIENNSFKLSGGTEISDNADLNNYKDIGSYYCDMDDKAKTIINSPTNGKAFTMKVIRAIGVGNNYKKQIISIYNSSKTYERSFLNDGENDNVWTEWKRYINTDDKTEIDTRLSSIESSNIVIKDTLGYEKINQWDEEYLYGYHLHENGTYCYDANELTSKNPVKVKPNTQYAFVHPSSRHSVLYYDENKNYIDFDYVEQSTFETPNNCYYIHINLGNQYGSTYNHNISVNYPSTYTNYHPYKDDVDTRLTANETALLTTKIASGNPISVSDSAHVNAEELKVELKPIQDLHGYDKPWVGGAGKNLLPLTVDQIKALNRNGVWYGNTFGTNGVNFTLNTDNDGNVTSISISGTPTTRAYIYLAYNLGLANGDYKINGYIGSQDYQSGISMYYGTTTQVLHYVTTQDGVLFTPPEDLTVVLNVAENTQIPSNTIAYPMIRLSSITDPTFEPYSNICPISGYDETSVVRTGKNMTVGIEQGTIHPDTNKVATDIRCGAKEFVAVKKNSTLTLNVNTNKSKELQICWYLCESNTFGGGNTIISGSDWMSNPAAITIPGNCYLLYTIRYSDDSTISSSDLSNIQLELGSTATSYEPYTANTYTLQFGDTVYGAEVDFVSGVATVKYGYVEFDGSSDEDWDIDLNRFTIDILQTCKATVDSIASISNLYETKTGDNVYANRETDGYTGIAVFGDGLYLVDNLNFDVSSKQLSDWKTYLSTNPLQVCYELATPYTIQLTPQQIKMLKGGNNVLTADGDITLEYQVNNALGEVKEWTENKIEDIQEEIDTRLTTNETALLTTKSASGNPISVSDSAHVNAEELTVELEPIQDLHGYDKPWAGGAGKNLLPIPDLPTTINGIRFSRNDDGSIEIERLSSSSNWATLILATNLALSSQCIATCEGGNNSTCFLEIDAVRVYQDVSVSLTDTVSTAQISVAPQFSGTTILKPMIRLATETDPTFEPYSNICPISGYDSTSVVRSGKNFTKAVYKGYPNTSSQTFTIDNDSESGVFYAIEGQTYVVSSSVEMNRCVMAYTNTLNLTNGTPISNITNFGDNTRVRAWTATWTGWTIWYVYAAGSADVESSLQIELGSTATSYEPYTADTYTLQFGDTVYGAKVDFVSGVATVKYGYESITQVTESSDFRETFTIPIPSNMKITNNDRTIPTNAICNQLQVLSITSVVFGSAIGLAYSTTSGVIFTRFPSSVGTTEADVNNYLASNPIQLCYELTQPYTIQLTPQQIKMLKGNNVLVADGDMDLTYQTDSVVGDVKESIEKEISILLNRVAAVEARLNELLDGNNTSF